MAQDETYPRASPAFVACVVVGLAINNVWYNLAGYNPAYASGLDVSSVTPLGRYGFMVACAVFLTAVGVLDRRIAPHFGIFARVAPALLLLGTGMLVLAEGGAFSDPGMLGILGSVLMGLGYSWNALSLYALQSSNGTSWQVILASILAFALSAALRTLIVETAGVPAQMIIVLCVPVVLPLLLRYTSGLGKRAWVGFALPDGCGALPVRKEGAGMRTAVREGLVRYRGYVLLLALATAAIIALRGLSTSGVYGAEQANGLFPAESTALGIGLYLAIALVTFHAYLSRRKLQRVHLPFLVLIAGFALLIALGAFDGAGRMPPLLVPAFTMTIELLCETAFSATINRGIRTLPYSPMRVAGLTMAFSWAFVMGWVLVFEHTDFAGSLAVLSVAYLLIVLIAVPSDLRRSSAAEPSASESERELTDGESADDQKR